MSFPLVRHLAACLALLAFALLAPVAQAQTGADPLGELMPKTGLKYTLRGEDVWKVTYDRDDGTTLDAYITYSNEQRRFALIMATVVDREANHPFSREVLEEAMKLSNDLVGVKFVLDASHGDIDCQQEVYLETATPQSLKMYIDMVATATDKNMARLQSL